MDTKVAEKVVVTNKPAERDFVFALGRRKSSTAEVRIYKKDTTVWGGTAIGRGEIFVNNKSAIEYFGKNFEKVFREPLQVTSSDKKYAVSIKVSGGGKMGQLDATILAIARGLDKIDRESFHSTLKKRGMLTRDPRVRERRKVGMGGKARRKRQSPKR